MATLVLGTKRANISNYECEERERKQATFFFINVIINWIAHYIVLALEKTAKFIKQAPSSAQLANRQLVDCQLAKENFRNKFC